MYYTTKNPEDIPFDDIPGEYIIKPNHGVDRYIILQTSDKYKEFFIKNSNCKQRIIFSDEAKVKIIDICKQWLQLRFGINKNEWGYQNIKPRIIIEKLLRDDGKIPNDYKLYMFHGKCKAILVCTNRLDNLGFIFYDVNWNLLPVVKGRLGEQVKKPEILNEVILTAEKLSEDFDFVRVDFYIIKDKFYCGELTHYSRSGLEKFTPTEFDFKLGSYWKIKKKYFFKNCLTHN